MFWRFLPTATISLSAPEFLMHPVAAEYIAHFAPSWDDRLGWENTRFVVLDTETTGLDPRRDTIVTIGAVGICSREIILDDSFEILIPFIHNTASVVIHGITRQLSETGVDQETALRHFLEYLRDGVIVGHHINHDIAMLNRALVQSFGIELKNNCVDTMDLTLRLSALGALPLDTTAPDFSLDGLCRLFNVRPADRHTAAGDAFITAQIFLKLLRLARRANLLRLGQLIGLGTDAAP